MFCRLCFVCRVKPLIFSRGLFMFLFHYYSCFIDDISVIYPLLCFRQSRKDYRSVKSRLTHEIASRRFATILLFVCRQH